MTAPFPHKVYARQTTCSVTVDHTLSVIASLNGDFALQDIDCRLHIDVGSDEGDLIWSVEAVSFEPINAPEIRLEAKDDPTMWELVRRSVMADFKRIDEEVAELAQEAA